MSEVDRIEELYGIVRKVSLIDRIGLGLKKEWGSNQAEVRVGGELSETDRGNPSAWRSVLGTFKQQQGGLWLELIQSDEVLVKTMVNPSPNVIYLFNHLKSF